MPSSIPMPGMDTFVEILGSLVLLWLAVLVAVIVVSFSRAPSRETRRTVQWIGGILLAVIPAAIVVYFNNG